MNVLLRILTVLLISMGLSACQYVSREQPTPTPTPVARAVEEVYRTLERERDINEARLRLREENREWWRFRGHIARIEERQVRFDIEPPRILAADSYVECNFRSNQEIASVNKGDDVALWGRIARAFRGRLFGIGEKKAVIFEDCRLSEIYASDAR